MILKGYTFHQIMIKYDLKQCFDTEMGEFSLVQKICLQIFTNIYRDGTMARLLMAIVVVFLCCHSTKIIVNFYEAVQVINTMNK